MSKIKLNDACTDEGVKVEFQELKSGFLVVFGRKFGGMGGEQFGEDLVLTKENKSVSAREMAQIIGTSQRAVERHLAHLIEKGIIKRRGRAKGG